MRLRDAIFPTTARTFAGKRWLTSLVRGLHLLGVAGIGGAFLYGSPADDWLPYLGLTVFSGLMLLGVEVWSNGLYLFQVRGITVIVKTLTFAALVRLQIFDPLLFAALVVASGAIAHAPGKLRHYSILHGKAIEY